MTAACHLHQHHDAGFTAGGRGVTVVRHAERHTTTQRERGVCLSGHPFHVLRMNVASLQDDHIRPATGDEQLSLVPYTKVPGAEPRGAAYAVTNATRPEYRGGFRWVSPVAAGHHLPAYPDLPFHAIRTAGGTVRLHNDHLTTNGWCTAAHQRNRGFGGVRSGDDQPPLTQRHGINTRRTRGSALRRTGHQQRGLGQAVTGDKHPRIKPRAGERLHEALLRGVVNRLGAVERHPHRRQVERRTFRCRGALHTQFPGKIGRCRGYRTEAMQQFQPREWPLQEGGGCHQHRGRADVQRLQNPANEPHVVIGRQPERHHLALAQAIRLVDGSRIRQQLAVREHDTTRGPRGTGGVLQNREIIRLGLRPVVYHRMIRRGCRYPVFVYLQQRNRRGPPRQGGKPSALADRHQRGRRRRVGQ